MFGLLKGILEVLYPTICYVCKNPATDPICNSCLETMPRLRGPICPTCGSPVPKQTLLACSDCRVRDFRFSIARSAVLYQGTAKEAVHQLKYRNGKRLAPFPADLMVGALPIDVLAADAVAYVPMSRRRESSRGFNQAKLLAEAIGKSLGLPVSSVLVRNKETVEQTKLPMSGRLSNVRGVFGVKKKVAGSFLLLDDVFTTGSTASECSAALLRGGAGEVKVATFARALPAQIALLTARQSGKILVGLPYGSVVASPSQSQAKGST